MSNNRPDRQGAHRTNYERNRKRILATQNTCGICGHPVDFNLKAPHPMSAVVDHIIPINPVGGGVGGHPSDLSNLQLAHWTCNRQKSNKILKTGHETKQVISNRVLPQSMDWVNYGKDNSKNNSRPTEKDVKENSKKEAKKIIIKIKRKVK